MGNPYPAEFLTSEGQVTEGGLLNFTDPDNIPGGGVDFLGWTDDAADPANVASNDGSLDLGDGVLSALIGAFSGNVIAAAAAATTQVPRISQLTSALTITSGALPNTGAWVSGTGKINPVARQIVVALEIVTDGTANAATCAVAISPDDTTYTTIATPGASVAVNTVGVVTLLSSVTVPAGWFIKITFAHCTVAASNYY